MENQKNVGRIRAGRTVSVPATHDETYVLEGTVEPLPSSVNLWSSWAARYRAGATRSVVFDSTHGRGCLRRRFGRREEMIRGDGGAARQHPPRSDVARCSARTGGKYKRRLSGRMAA